MADTVTIQEGVASFYAERFHLRRTANGEIFHMDSLTAAHKYLPFDTWVKVTRIDTRDSVWVRINDRLPKNSKRIIDLSKAAGQQINMMEVGITEVRLEVRNISEMNRLYEYFQDHSKGGVRVRFFESAVEPIATPDLNGYDWIEKNTKLFSRPQWSF